MTEKYFEMPYRVIDLLPERVPEGSPGQYFAVEEYYLRPEQLSRVRRRFTDLLLKLNCYYELQAFPEDAEQPEANPAPAALDRWINGEQKDLRILIPGEDALITLNRGDLYMTAYHVSGSLERLLERLAGAEGLFLRNPEQENGSGGQAAEMPGE